MIARDPDDAPPPRGSRAPVDVLAFVAIIVAYLWVVRPLAGGSRLPYWIFVLAALGVVARSSRRRRQGARENGLRLDNLLPALAVYVGSAVALAGVFLFFYRESIVPWQSRPDEGWRAAKLLAWALLQQYCLLAFVLARLRETLGRDAAAVLGATAIFALLHLPNPFLTLYTVGGGLVATSLYLRWPNVIAAAVAHATATVLVSRLLPDAITMSLRVGPR